MNTTAVLAVLAAVLLLFSGAFAVDMGERQRPNPVDFDDTIRLGSTGVSIVEAETRNIEIPRGEVFFSQYRYAVGYHGITWLVDDLQRADTTQQFGTPLAVYVTDFSGARVELTEEGYIRLPDYPGSYERWVAAEYATFVVGSRARTPTGPAVLAFSDLGDARDFADAHGGTLHDWSTVRTMSFDTAQATSAGLDTARRDRGDWADSTVSDASSLLERPVSVVVGSDAPSVQAAIDQAPPNTTVVVPDGTYDANLSVSKPLTIRGEGNGTHLRGDGTGSVLTANTERVAVTNVRISGVGNTTSLDEPPGNATDWDARVLQGYAYGDAGLVFERANGSYVHDVAIDTPANGVVLRWSDDTVVDGVTVTGSEEWLDGFMGVMNVGSRVVVQHSTFDGGRDGVYTHRAHGVVVRDNTMRGMRFGVHEMYTSDALVENNVVRGTDVGLIVMTRPTGNVLVDNDVRESDIGVAVSGSASWVAGNVLADNRVGMYVSARRSRYERNVVVGNAVGLRASSIIPTNQVVGNDVVGNDRAAVGILGPLRIWPGNYWASAPGRDVNGDGTIDRAFQPTGPVDGRVGRVAGADTLATSPAVNSIRALQSAVPGLRGTGVIDPRPRATPTRPDVLDRLNATTHR